MSDFDDLNILIISFFFPPYKNVGSRRWAKHSKYLKKNGIKFKILAGDFPHMTSPWDNDIKNYKGDISRVKINFTKPFFKRTLPTNLFQKVIWKLSYKYHQIRVKKDKFQYTDHSKKYTKKFYLKAKKIILEENINVVILSVGPFHYASIIPQLQKEFPHIRFYVDFRDPWLETVQNLGEKQKLNIRQLKEHIISRLEGVISVNEELVNYYRDKYAVNNSFSLEHAYDPYDIPTQVYNENKNESIQLIYGGSLYQNIEHVFENLKKLVEISNQYSPTKITIYSLYENYPDQLNNANIEVHTKLLNVGEFLEKSKASDYVILILPPNRVNAKSSKFFELIALRVPILYFGEKGEISTFLEENQLGVHVTSENVVEVAEKISTKYDFNLNRHYDLSQNTFEKTTNDLLKFLSS